VVTNTTTLTVLSRVNAWVTANGVGVTNLSVLSGLAPFSLAVSADGLDGFPLYAVVWTSGDGGSVPSDSTTFVYSTAGVYTVGVTVTDRLGYVAETDFQLNVTSLTTVPPPPPLSVSASNSEQLPGTGSACGTTLADFVAEPMGGTPPYTLDWSFGDGGAGNGSPISHRYVSAGVYPVLVTVQDASGTVNSTMISFAAPRSDCPTHASASSVPGWLLSVGVPVVGVALVAIAAMVLFRRRRRRSPPSTRG
jgi:chitodextrinase